MFEVLNRTATPYNTVCYIVCEWPDGSFSSGSGVVVGLNDVLTAAHVVYNQDRGGFASSITVYPAADTSPFLVTPYGAFTDWGVVNVRTTNWDTNGDRLLSADEAQYDLAVIGMRTPIGSTTGWAAMWGLSSDLYGTMVGYPAAPYGGTGMMAANIYADASSSWGVFNIGDRLGPGSSGGPLFYTENGNSYVVGIASSGDDDESTYAGLFGPGNWSWLQTAMQQNDSYITGASFGDDYAASTATTGVVLVGGAANGTVEVITDEDWFRLSIVQAGTYTIELTGGSLEDPYLSLYNASGNKIQSNDDIQAGVVLDARLTVSLQAGTYFIGASSYWEQDYLPSPGTYTLSVTQGGAGTAFVGTAGDDSLTGTSLDESFVGNGGNDVLNGMGGFDTAFYEGLRGEYLLGRAGGAITVFDTFQVDGTDTLYNMERVEFADMSVNLRIGANSLTIAPGGLKLLQELYVAFFNRVPDADGLSFWIDQYRGGMSISAIAEAFYAAALLYPVETGYSSTMSNTDFVNVVYRNVLGREEGADAGGLAYWTAALASGAETRGTLVSTIINVAHMFKGDPTWGWVADLLDNKADVANLFAVEMGLSYNSPSDSITEGMAIADAVTPTSTAAAVALIGVSDGFSTLG